MPAPGTLLRSLLSLDSVQLGRLVVNAVDPLEGFHDPLGPSPPETTTIKRQQTFHEVLTLSKSVTLRTSLTALFSTSFERRTTSALTLTADFATSYKLANFATWLRDACREKETRKWFEMMLLSYSDMYLVVGFHTLTNAHVSQEAGVVRGVGGGVQVPEQGPSVGALREVEKTVKAGVEAAGEQIYAVEYRKLRFRWFSSRTMENWALESRNRWKIFLPEIRGEPAGSSDEDGDDEDVLEVELAEEEGEEE